jgi:hypothetical protein
MGTIKYQRGRLLGAAFFMAVVAILLLMIFIDPDIFGHSRRARFFQTGFGHYIFLPALMMCSALAAWRFAATSFGDLKALEATPAFLVATSFWGKRKIAWRDLVDAQISTVKSGFWTQYNLMLKTNTGGLFGGKKIRVPLTGTGLSAADMPALLSQIARAKEGALSSPGAVAAPRAVREDEPSSDFDAQAALARYMAKKASGQIEVVAPQPTVPPRPAFGRKQVGS